MNAFIVYSDYTNENEETKIRLFGRLDSGESFVSVFDFKPYFYIKEKDEKKVSKYLKKFKVEKTNLTNFSKEKILKITAKNQTELNKLYKVLHKTIDTYEADVKPHMRFLMDSNILSDINIEGDSQSSDKVDRIYINPHIKPLKEEHSPELKVLSFDIETDKTSDKLFCIGIYGKNLKKNFMVTERKDLENTISCKDEEECLEKFKQEIIKQDPDIITGWNSIDFDLQYLQNKFRKYKIPFDIGRTNDNIRLRIESNFFRSSSADIPGRQMLDALNLFRDPLVGNSPLMKKYAFDSFTLEEASQKTLGYGKIMPEKDRHDEIESIYKKQSKESLQKLSDYNLKDCELPFKILEKTHILELVIERAQLTGLSLDRLSSSIASFDSLYIREANSRGLVSPTLSFTESEERIKGGYVFSNKAGIYHNVLIMDFKSLYPSIIRTFNIDPSSFLGKNKEKNSIESPNKAYFSYKEGVLPEIIQKLHEAREKAKKEKRELASYAIKITMNSFFGVLASPNCRYFSLDIANAITHFGQFIIQLTAQEIEKLKFKVIYMDTDSVFIETNLDKDKANKAGREIQDKINKFYDDYVKKNYNKKSYLELQFEKQYLSMMIPQVRMKSEEVVAAKKRYAGLVEKNENGKIKEELQITGLEAIRGDWTDAAQDFQRQLLMKVFKKQEITKFIKDYILDIKSGKLDKLLIYRKSIRKELDEYTKTTPPHVKAARKLDKLEGNIIEYVLTSDGPEPIQKLKHEIDYEHYIDKQIKPIANQVLVLFNRSFDEILQGSKQAKLF